MGLPRTPQVVYFSELKDFALGRIATVDVTLDVRVAMLAGDTIEFGLDGGAVGLFLIKCEFSSTGVTRIYSSTC